MPTYTGSLIKDSFVSEANPTTNYGSTQSMQVGSISNGTKNYYLMDFDLSGLPDGITISKIEFAPSRVLPGSGTNFMVFFMFIQEDWQEDTVTFQNCPPTFPMPEQFLATFALRGGATFETQLPGFANSWSWKSNRKGIIIKPENGWGSITARDGSLLSASFATITITYELGAPAPQLDLRVGGTWKKATPSVRVGGAWKDVSEAYIRVGGAWKKI